MSTPPTRSAFRAPDPVLPRRRALRGLAALAGASTLPWLAGCATPLPIGLQAGGRDSGLQRLQASAQAHGWDAYRRLTDINIAYDGQWRPFIDRIQPVVVDKGFRGPSEERLLPHRGVNAQAYRGPDGRKQVFWQRATAGHPGSSSGDSADAPGEIAVWFNGQAAADPGVLDAAALVAEAYGLFLLGPLWVAGRGVAGPGLQAELAGTQRVDGRLCDVVEVWMRPGLGRVALDRVALCIDRDDHTTRRLRFTLEGYSGTRGAVAEVDTFEHQRRFGVLWPMRSYERVVHPLRLPAHDWHITGLDVDRGHGVEALRGAVFTGAAAAPAKALG
jgi:hypothetical protein